MEVARALTSGAIVSIITAGVGFMSGNLNLTIVGMDGALMAASVLAADAANLKQIPVPPGLVAGAVYSAGQKFIRNDDNYIINGAIGFTADYITDSVM